MCIYIEILPEHAAIIAKACALLSDLHIGNLAQIATVPRVNEDADTLQWRSELTALSPYITGKASNQTLDLKDEVVPEEARIASDISKIILSQLNGDTKLLNELISNQISPNQIQFVGSSNDEELCHVI